MNQFENLLLCFQSWEAPQAETVLYWGSWVPPSQSVKFSEDEDNVTLWCPLEQYLSSSIWKAIWTKLNGFSLFQCKTLNLMVWTSGLM